MASKKTAKKKASVKAPAKKTARKLKGSVKSVRKAKEPSLVAGRKVRVGALKGMNLGTSGGSAKTRKVRGKIRSASR